MLDERKVQGELQLAITLLKMNTKKRLLQFVKTPIPPLGSLLVNKEENCGNISRCAESEVNVRSGYVKNGHKKKLPSYLNSNKVTKLNGDINQENESC